MIKEKLQRIDRERLVSEKQRLRLLRKDDKIYCEQCSKWYKENQCRINLNFEEGGWYNDTETTCSRDHTFIIDD